MRLAVAYAINSKRTYWKLLELSLTSLRLHSPRIPVFVFCFGKPPIDANIFSVNFGVKVILRPQVPDALGWCLKWMSLGEVKTERLLFLDVDTYFYKPAENFVNRYRAKDFYARKEIGAGRAALYGPLFIRNSLHNSLYKSISRKLGGRTVPVFNSGVMIWNHGAHGEWKQTLPVFMDLVRNMKMNRLKLVSHPPLIDEVAGSLCLGLVKGLKWGNIRRSDSPWYPEWKFNLVRSKGFLMHVHSGYAGQWAQEEFGNSIVTKQLARAARKDNIKFSDSTLPIAAGGHYQKISQ